MRVHQLFFIKKIFMVTLLFRDGYSNSLEWQIDLINYDLRTHSLPCAVVGISLR